MTILADFGNLLSHLNVFSKKNHSVSCLICGNREQDRNNKFKHTINSFYPITSSSDLVLVHSNEVKKIRQLMFLKGKNLINGEICFQRELKIYLNFDIKNQIQDNIAILVIVVNPQILITDELKEILRNRRKKNYTIIICQEEEKDFFSRLSSTLIIYRDYETTLQYLVHISMITKQRIRIKDIHTYLPSKYGYLISEQDENQCLFI